MDVTEITPWQRIVFTNRAPRRLTASNPASTLVAAPHLNLYGGTTDVATARQAGIKIALAPDWSPSGSDGMLQELKYASKWNHGQYPKVFTDAERVQMASSIPAQFAGLFDKIGSIKPGSSADLLLVRRTEKDPYQSLLNALTRRHPRRPHRRQPRLWRRRPDAQTLPRQRPRRTHRLRRRQGP
jgi:cytosine/adenosine deaminase-related metal-dependent hydrolase